MMKANKTTSKTIAVRDMGNLRMKRSTPLWWGAMLFCAPIPQLFAQGVPVNLQILLPSNTAIPGQSVNVMTMPGAKIAFCNAPNVGVPCTNIAPLFSDVALTHAIANPVQTNALGQAFFYVASGQYTYTVTTAAGTTVRTVFPYIAGAGSATDAQARALATSANTNASEAQLTAQQASTAAAAAQTTATQANTAATSAGTTATSALQAANAALPASGTAVKATALAATPNPCPTGQKAQGIDAQGNSLGCSAASGGANLTPSAIQYGTSASATRAATATDVGSLFTGANGCYLRQDGSCAVPATGTGTPGGVDSEVQTNTQNQALAGSGIFSNSQRVASNIPQFRSTNTQRIMSFGNVTDASIDSSDLSQISPSGLGQHDFVSEFNSVFGQGVNFGSGSSPSFQTSAGWSVSHNRNTTLLHYRRGISQGELVTGYAGHIGDFALKYLYGAYAGGNQESGGEGDSLLVLNGGQFAGDFTGTITNAVSNGSTAITVACGQYCNYAIDGGGLIDVSQPVGTYHATADDFVDHLTIDSALTMPTAVGYLTTSVTAAPNGNAGTSVAAAVTVTSGTFNTSSPFWGACQESLEAFTPSAVSALSNGSQTVTGNFRQSHTVTGSTSCPVFQGGLGELSIDLLADHRTGYSSFAPTGAMRTDIPAFVQSVSGSTTTLLYRNYAGSAPTRIPDFMHVYGTGTAAQVTLYPRAEVIEVGSSPVVDSANKRAYYVPSGALTAIANSVAWKQGDTVEIPAPATVLNQPFIAHIYVNSPPPVTGGESSGTYDATGAGVTGVGYSGLRVWNSTPLTQYNTFGTGGLALPDAAIEIGGSQAGSPTGNGAWNSAIHVKGPTVFGLNMDPTPTDSQNVRVPVFVRSKQSGKNSFQLHTDIPNQATLFGYVGTEATITPQGWTLPGVLTLPGYANGCLQVSGGTVQSTTCGSGGGGSAAPANTPVLASDANGNPIAANAAGIRRTLADGTTSQLVASTGSDTPATDSTHEKLVAVTDPNNPNATVWQKYRTNGTKDTLVAGVSEVLSLLQGLPNCTVSGAVFNIVGGNCTLPSGTTPTYVNKSSISQNGTVTYNVKNNNTGLVVYVYWQNLNVQPTLTDLANSTVTSLGYKASTNGSSYVAGFVLTGIALGSDTLTISFNGSPANLNWQAVEYANTKQGASPVESGGSTSGTAATMTCSGVTTTATNRRVIVISNAYAPTNSSYSSDASISSQSTYLQTLSVASASTVTPTFTLGGSSNYACIDAALIPN